MAGCSARGAESGDFTAASTRTLSFPASPSTSSSSSTRLTPCTYPMSTAKSSSPYGTGSPISSYAKGSRGHRSCSASAFPQSSTRGPLVARGAPGSLSTKASGSIVRHLSQSTVPSPARPLPHMLRAAITSVAPARNSPSISEGSSVSISTTTRLTRPSAVRRATVFRTSSASNRAAAIIAAPRRDGNARAMDTSPSRSPTRSTCAPASRPSTSRCSNP